jgi:hypothetical protein
MRRAEAHGPPPTRFPVVHRGVEVADEPVTGHPEFEQGVEA